MNSQMTRRDFIHRTAMFSALGVAPQFLTRTVEAATQSIDGFTDDRVLVVVQLGGGNDGLNTVVPYSDDLYYKARPKLGLKKDGLIAINDDVALNSRLTGLMDLYGAGQLAIVQGVGYPNPDRSHFRSMDIWHSASDSDQFLSSGWVGRYFDHHCNGDGRPQAGVAIGNSRPQAFNGDKGLGVAFQDPNAFGWQPGPGEDNLARFAELNDGNGKTDSNLDFLRHVTSNAILSSREVKKSAERGRYKPGRGAPFHRSLRTVAAMIRGDLATRVFFVSATGFDTHANQAGLHGNLLAQVGDGLAEFQKTLTEDGTAGRVMTMVFSEFGRRVAENNSGGTDHGTAAPLFLVGEGVRPGLAGTAPRLDALDRGDLKHTTDFRTVYAALLEKWFKVDSSAVLGGRFVPANVIA